MREIEKKLFNIVTSSRDLDARAAIGIYWPDPDFPDPKDENIDLNVKDEHGFTLLHYAVKRGLENTVVRLLGYGALVDSKDNNGCTPLVLATTLLPQQKINDFHIPKIPTIIQTLVGHGANVFSTNEDQYSCLHLAVSANQLEVLKLFSSKIQDHSLNVVNKYGQTPLQLAVTLGDACMVKYFVDELKAEVNFQSPNGRTSLHYAALDNRANIIPILSQLSAEGGIPLAEISLKDNAGYTPLRIAQKMKHDAAREELQKAEKRFLEEQHERKSDAKILEGMPRLD